MIQFFRPVFFILSFFVCIKITAQVTPPVQFNFSANRDASGKAFVLIKAKVQPGVHLFSAIKKTPDDAFISTIDFDSTVKKYLKDSLVENGAQKTLKDETTGGMD